MNPDLRSFPSGKEMYGVYRIGTPLKSRRMPRPVPVRSAVSRSMSPALSTQSSLPAGQVVYLTSSRLTCPSRLTTISLAEPRAGREGSSNSAPPNEAPPAASYLPVSPRTRTSGSWYSTLPSMLRLCVASSYCTSSALRCRSPCRTSTLPFNSASPVRLSSAPWLLTSMSSSAGLVVDVAGGNGAATGPQSCPWSLLSAFAQQGSSAAAQLQASTNRKASAGKREQRDKVIKYLIFTGVLRSDTL